MLHRFSRKKQSLLKIKVNKDDSIEMEGRLNTKEPNPMIVIGFENNRDGYSNIKQQIESLKIALTYLLDHYHFTEFKAVGHSNGGLVLTGLLESGFLEKKKGNRQQTWLLLAVLTNSIKKCLTIFKNGSIA